jgi:hypothetical protein
MVGYIPYSMGRMKSLWGDDALDFKPERWLGQDGRFEPQPLFKFTAFQVLRHSHRTARYVLCKLLSLRFMQSLRAVIFFNN